MIKMLKESFHDLMFLNDGQYILGDRSLLLLIDTPIVQSAMGDF